MHNFYSCIFIHKYIDFICIYNKKAPEEQIL